jgi:hypothetical protein
MMRTPDLMSPIVDRYFACCNASIPGTTESVINREITGSSKE